MCSLCRSSSLWVLKVLPQVSHTNMLGGILPEGSSSTRSALGREARIGKEKKQFILNVPNFTVYFQFLKIGCCIAVVTKKEKRGLGWGKLLSAVSAEGARFIVRCAAVRAVPCCLCWRRRCGGYSVGWRLCLGRF